MTNSPQTALAVHVRPGAKRNEIKAFVDGAVHLNIAAPPVEGKANKELIEFLSELLDTAKSNVTVERGLTGRSKTLLVRGMTMDQILHKLGLKLLI